MAPGRRFPVLAGDMAVDVAVVSSGTAGLAAAWLLERAGKRGAELEMNRLPPKAQDDSPTPTEMNDERA
jgi:hypothetical protein